MVACTRARRTFSKGGSVSSTPWRWPFLRLVSTIGRMSRTTERSCDPDRCPTPLGTTTSSSECSVRRPRSVSIATTPSWTRNNSSSSRCRCQLTWPWHTNTLKARSPTLANCTTRNGWSSLLAASANLTTSSAIFARLLGRFHVHDYPVKIGLAGMQPALNGFGQRVSFSERLIARLRNMQGGCQAPGKAVQRNIVRRARARHLIGKGDQSLFQRCLAVGRHTAVLVGQVVGQRFQVIYQPFEMGTCGTTSLLH